MCLIGRNKLPLLQGYTIGFIDEYCKKISIQFIDNKPSDYEKNQIIKFFRKYKKNTFIDRDKENINYMVINWEYWVEFLIKLGFRDTANAICSILNDLETNYKIDPASYLETISKAKPVDIHKEPKCVDIDDRTEEYKRRLEREELKRLMKGEDEND